MLSFVLRLFLSNVLPLREENDKNLWTLTVHFCGPDRMTFYSLYTGPLRTERPVVVQLLVCVLTKYDLEGWMSVGWSTDVYTLTLGVSGRLDSS